MTSGDGDQPIIAIFQPDKVAVEECSAPKIRRHRPIIRSAFVDGQASADLLTPICSADLNGDGSVGASDLLALLMAWGQNSGHPADFDGNGSVGASDLLTLLVNWGPCP